MPCIEGMREVHLSWNTQSIKNSDFGLIIEVVSDFEVIAHLDVTAVGVRQLVRVKLNEGMNVNDLDTIPFLEVDGPLRPHPLPQEGGEGIIVVWNRHPISVAAINFDSLHVIPPYTIGKEGAQITIRGLPDGVSGFLKAARLLLPPDSVKVVDIENVEREMLSVLTPKQLESTVIATNAGYYENPRLITMRELSELSGIPRSTLQEHLAKAEAAMMNWAARVHQNGL